MDFSSLQKPILKFFKFLSIFIPCLLDIAIIFHHELKGSFLSESSVERDDPSVIIEDLIIDSHFLLFPEKHDPVIL